jgi:hypothetical protein
LLLTFLFTDIFPNFQRSGAMNFNIFQVLDVMDVLAHRAQQEEQQRAQQRRLVLVNFCDYILLRFWNRN